MPVARNVYGEYELLRSAAVLLPHLGATLTLPDDIPVLVQRAYGDDRIGPDEWQDTLTRARAAWLAKIEARTDKAEAFQIRRPARPGKAIVGWLTANVGDTDDESQGQGQVRDGAPSLEAVLIVADSDGWFTPPWLPDGAGDVPVPRDSAPSDEIAGILATCALRLPLEFSNPESEQELWDQTPEEWEFSLIYNLPVLVVDRAGNGTINGRRIRYTQRNGLEVFARDEQADAPDLSEQS
ncbi:hypothetical protein [Nocardia cyriacigeorgica]|uniref:hypothetical protein n=1 Tax=Nocardia cyriacigeorgica TaxID=135487 RepID=UPI001E3529C6|nr:hypothetical protein [Nocardia cyriacigeorgica]